MHCQLPTCNKTLPESMRADARYCSDTCRMAAVTERRRKPPRKCECYRPLSGRALLCPDCREAHRRMGDKDDYEVRLLKAYRDAAREADKIWRKFEAEAERSCFGEAMHDIVYVLLAADDSPLSQHEKESLAPDGRHVHTVEGGGKITGYTSPLRAVLTKYRGHPLVRDKIEARLDELAERHKRLRHGVRHGRPALRFR